MENGARAGIFYRLHDVRKLPCPYVFFECKNYVTEVAHPELDQTRQGMVVRFIKHFGCNVNLGNIPPSEVIALETIRQGPRADTMAMRNGDDGK